MKFTERRIFKSSIGVNVIARKVLIDSLFIHDRLRLTQRLLSLTMAPASRNDAAGLCSRYGDYAFGIGAWKNQMPKPKTIIPHQIHNPENP